MSTDNMAGWIWNVKSIDEYFDEQLKGKPKDEQLKMIAQYSEPLREWLTKKINFGIGMPVIVWIRAGSSSCVQIKSYEDFIRYKERIFTTGALRNKIM